MFSIYSTWGVGSDPSIPDPFATLHYVLNRNFVRTICPYFKDLWSSKYLQKKVKMKKFDLFRYRTKLMFELRMRQCLHYSVPVP